MARGTVWLEQVTSSSTPQPGCGQSSERSQTPRTVSCFRSTGSALPAGRPAPTTSIRVKKSASRSSRAGWGLRVAGVERQHGSGYTIVVPACVPHAAWNAGDGEVHVLVDFRPALRTEVAFEALAGLARDGRRRGQESRGTRSGWRWSSASSLTRSGSSDRRWPSRKRSWVLWPGSGGRSGTERNTPIDRTCANAAS
jgi:hypothetical protein